MQIEVITQSAIGNTQWRCVGDVLNAVTARPDCQRFRFAVAYMRVSGLRPLYTTLQALCARSGRISGAVGIDQGITTIEALELLRQLSSDSTVVCTVSNYIYHPKLYLVEGDTWACAVVGSANLTRDGLYRNVEFGTILHLDLASSADIKIYQDYDVFLKELLNPRNPNVQPLNATTLTWLAEMVIVEDEARVPEPQSVLRSRRVTAKLKDFFPSLPVPSVPTVSEIATVPNIEKETSAVPFEKLPSRSHKEWALPSVGAVASISSTITSPSSLSAGKQEQTSWNETTSSPSSTVEGQLQLLVRLQELESALPRLDEAVVAKSQEIEALTRRRDEMRDAIITQRREQENLDEQRRRLELEVTGEEYKLQKAQSMLREIRTNKEYAAKLVEIERVKQKISEREDSILQLRQVAEQSKEELQEAANRLIQEEHKLAEERQHKETELAVLRQVLAEKRHLREETMGHIERSLLDRYLRLLSARKGLAVACIKDRACQGCFLNLPPQLVQEIRRHDRVLTCCHCDRILYWTPERGQSPLDSGSPELVG
jgi:uncharacterized protein